MKKKYVAAAIAAGILGLSCATIVCININKSDKNTNPSRRDGKAVVGDVPEDDTLVMLTGESAPEASEDSSVLNSEENVSADKIIEKIDQASVIVINEALTVSGGDEEAFYSNEDFADILPVDADCFLTKEIPSKYDSRDVSGKCYVTGIEDQGYSSLCWAYAALGAIESDILKNHSNISAKDLDLSEKHLAYHNVHRSEGSRGGYIDDDYRELVNPDNEAGAWIFDYDTGYVAVGGVSDYCISLLTAWKGPVYEKGSDAFKSIYGSEYLYKDNKDKPSDAYAADFHVQDVSQVRGDIKNNLLIKKMIMKHGGVTAGVNSDEKFWKDSHRTLYSHFENEDVPTASHEAVIIGWDDDYSPDNFVQKPEDKGAWLCKNSWGEVAGDKGYFYLSYYDDTVAIDSISAYSVAAKGDEDYYDNNYQVAGFLTNVESALDDSLNTVFAYDGNESPYGVMYEAQDDEILKAIGFMSLDCYGQYELRIYKNVEAVDGKIDGDLLKKPEIAQKISAISAGYHTFKLNDAIPLSKGDKFLLEIIPVTEGKLVFEASADNVSPKNYDEWKNLTGSFDNNYTASGMSYYISEDGLSLESQKDKDFFVKAYTNNTEQTFENK